MSPVNSLIELHDSKVSAIARRGAFICVDFTPAYFHWSAGQPGRDPGSGWIQDATLWFEDAEVTGLVPELPCDVFEGELRAGAQVHSNLIPVPFQSRESVKLLVRFSPECRVAVCGSSAWLDLLGDPRYVDEFRP
jgi:hypothetical protein